MEQLSQQQQLLKSIIDRELYEIEEEVSNEDNSDISTVIAFNIERLSQILQKL